MSWGIFALASGSFIAWFRSEEKAREAFQQLISDEPLAARCVVLVEFYSNGVVRHIEHPYVGNKICDEEYPP